MRIGLVFIRENYMKKIFLALISLIMAFSLYAQNVKSVGLSDSDVKNWAKNLNPIVKGITSHWGLDK